MTGERDRKHAGRRRAALLSAVTVAAAVALVPTAKAAGAPLQALPASPASARDAAPAGPFVTLLFSRTEISAADNCVEDDDNIARLDTTVAPYLQSLGMAGAGTACGLGTGRPGWFPRFPQVGPPGAGKLIFQLAAPFRLLSPSP